MRKVSKKNNLWLQTTVAITSTLISDQMVTSGDTLEEQCRPHATESLRNPEQQPYFRLNFSVVHLEDTRLTRCNRPPPRAHYLNSRTIYPMT